MGLAAACPASTSAGVLATGPAPSGPHSGPLRPPSGLAESQTHREREEQMFSLHDKSKQRCNFFCVCSISRNKHPKIKWRNPVAFVLKILKLIRVTTGTFGIDRGLSG